MVDEASPHFRVTERAEPNKRLSAFVAITIWDLDVLVGLREVLWLGPGRQSVDDVELVRRLGPAWDELVQVVPQLFDRLDQLEEALTKETPAPLQTGLLAERGLTGAQLDAKLAAWWAARERLLSLFAESDDPRPRYPELSALIADRSTVAGGAQGGPNLWQSSLKSHVRNPMPWAAGVIGIDSQLPRWWEKSLRAICESLDHAGTVLKSLAAVVGLSEPVGEVVDLVKKMSCHAAENAAQQRSGH
jgi:hypothetical protein